MNFQNHVSNEDHAATIIARWWKVVLMWNKCVEQSHLSDHKSYCENRCKNLSQLFGKHYSSHYGMRIADDRGAIGSLDLVLHRIGNPMYLRDNHEEARSFFRSLGESLNINSGQIDRRYFFVNSPLVTTKMKILMEKYDDVVLSSECKTISNGLAILDVKFRDDAETPELIFKSWLNRIGATPSLYQVMYQLTANEQIPDEFHKLSDNLEELRLLMDPHLKQQILRSSSEYELATSHLRESAWLLISGIIDLSNSNKLIQSNPMIKDSLAHLHKVISGMAYFRSNLLRCTRLFELVSDDIFTILSISHPYSPQDLSSIISNSYRSRYPNLASFISTSHLTSGGMDALSSALCSLSPGRIVRLEPSHDYLELSYLVEDGHSSSHEPSIIVANLNASVPSSRLDPVILSNKIKSLNSVSALVLDVTIETPDSLLESLVTNVLKNNNKMTIILCKSFQKYATLGTAKVMAGCHIVLNNNSNFLNNWEYNLKTPEWPEMQLIGHIFKYAPLAEFQFVKRAAKNAEFVNTMWPCSGTNDCYAHGLPFVTKGKVGSRWAFQKETNSQLMPLGKLATLLPFEDRDSFSSIMSSFLSMDSVVRFNIGQEATSQLVEKFFACSALLAPQESGIVKEITWKTIKDIFVQVMDKPSIKELSHTGIFVHNKLGSLLDFASRALVLPTKDQEELATWISQFLILKPKISSPLKIDLLSYYLKALLITGKLDNSILDLCSQIPAYRCAQVFINYGEDTVFETLEKETKLRIVWLSYNRLVPEHRDGVFKQLLSKRQFNKAALCTPVSGILVEELKKLQLESEKQLETPVEVVEAVTIFCQKYYLLNKEEADFKKKLAEILVNLVSITSEYEYDNTMLSEVFKKDCKLDSTLKALLANPGLWKLRPAVFVQNVVSKLLNKS